MTSRYSPGKRRRMLRCRTRKARFAQRKGSPLFGYHLEPEKVGSILGHVAEGCGVRQTVLGVLMPRPGTRQQPTRLEKRLLPQVRPP